MLFGTGQSYTFLRWHGLEARYGTLDNGDNDTHSICFHAIEKFNIVRSMRKTFPRWFGLRVQLKGQLLNNPLGPEKHSILQSTSDERIS